MKHPSGLMLTATGQALSPGCTACYLGALDPRVELLSSTKGSFFFFYPQHQKSEKPALAGWALQLLPAGDFGICDSISYDSSSTLQQALGLSFPAEALIWQQLLPWTFVGVGFGGIQGSGITEGVMLDGILPCPFPAFQVCGEEAALGYGLVKVWRRSLG